LSEYKMNNTTTTTKRNLTIVAVFMAATLVVGIGTFTTTTTTQSAYAYQQKKGGGDNGKGNGNGNTVTTEECKNRGSSSGFDTALDQECENLICTHPGENATCTQEGLVAAAVAQTPVIPAQGNPGPKPVITQGSLAVSGTGVLTGQLTVTQQGTVYNVQISGSATGVTSQTCTNIHNDKPRTVSSGQFAASGTTLVNGGGAVNSGNSFSIQLSPTSGTIREECNSQEMPGPVRTTFSNIQATITGYTQTP
jgi:hypothetical protein